MEEDWTIKCRNCGKMLGDHSSDLNECPKVVTKHGIIKETLKTKFEPINKRYEMIINE